MKRIGSAGIIFVMVLLMGCQQQPKVRDEAYFMLHPDKIRPQLIQCERMTTVQASCLAAKKAEAQVSVMLLAAQANPEGFGKQILQLQMQIASTQAKVKAMETQTAHNKKQASPSKALIALKTQLAKTQFQYQVRLSVIALMGI